MAQQPKQEKSTIDALKDISNLLDKMNKRHECKEMKNLLNKSIKFNINDGYL